MAKEYNSDMHDEVIDELPTNDHFSPGNFLHVLKQIHENDLIAQSRQFHVHIDN
jgi:hypothetical protein